MTRQDRRDRYIAAAMTGLLSGRQQPCNPETLGLAAIEIADALMKLLDEETDDEHATQDGRIFGPPI